MSTTDAAVLSLSVCSSSAAVRYIDLYIPSPSLSGFWLGQTRAMHLGQILVTFQMILHSWCRQQMQQCSLSLRNGSAAVGYIDFYIPSPSLSGFWLGQTRAMHLGLILAHFRMISHSCCWQQMQQCSLSVCNSSAAVRYIDLYIPSP